MSENKKAAARAEERYDMDYKGIALNTAVSAVSSVSASGLLNLFQSIPVDQLPLVMSVLFVAQVLPKMLVEINKNYARNKARQKAFKDGLLSEKLSKNKKATMLDTFFSFCDHASYF